MGFAYLINCRTETINLKSLLERLTQCAKVSDGLTYVALTYSVAAGHFVAVLWPFHSNQKELFYVVR
jgi:hypothetical protein